MRRNDEYYTSVIVLNAGGTINMEGREERRPSKKVEGMLERLKNELYKKYKTSVIMENIFDRPPDSSNVGEKEWENIYEKIVNIIKRKVEIEQALKEEGIKKEKGGIVITHGTDTMEITSLAVSFLLKMNEENNLPVIFTGSYATIDDPDSDALKNLKKSIIAAKEKFNRDVNLPPGVYVVIGKDIHLAARLAKVYSQPNSDGKYFFSFPGPIGQITGDQIKINFNYLNSLLSTKVEIKEMKKWYEKEWGIVEHLVLDSFSSPKVLSDFLDRYHYYKANKNYKNRNIGLIIQGNFVQNSRIDEMVEYIDQISSLEVPVFVGSKKVYEFILIKRPIKNLGLIHKSMSYSKARTKLSWLLRFSIPPEQILKLMEENILGEIYDTEELPEWINYETFPNQRKGVEVVVIYPNIDKKVVEDAIKRVKEEESQRKEVYLFGFGDGHIPTINKSIQEIVEEFIQKRLRESIKLEKSKVEDLIKEIEEKIKTNKSLQHSILKFLFGFEIRAENLKNQISKLKLEKIRIKQKEEVKKKVKTLFEELERNEKNIKIKNKEAIMELFLKEIKFEIPNELIDDLKKETKHMLEESSDEEIKKILIENYASLIAKRIVKEALMESSPILKEIGEATDEGIKIFVKSQAVRAKTDTSKYEIGSMLRCVGVDSDAVKGWRTDYLVRKA